MEELESSIQEGFTDFAHDIVSQKPKVRNVPNAVRASIEAHGLQSQELSDAACHYLYDVARFVSYYSEVTSSELDPESQILLIDALHNAFSIMSYIRISGYSLPEAAHPVIQRMTGIKPLGLNEMGHVSLIATGDANLLQSYTEQASSLPAFIHYTQLLQIGSLLRTRHPDLVDRILELNLWDSKRSDREVVIGELGFDNKFDDIPGASRAAFLEAQWKSVIIIPILQAALLISKEGIGARNIQIISRIINTQLQGRIFASVPSQVFPDPESSNLRTKYRLVTILKAGVTWFTLHERQNMSTVIQRHIQEIKDKFREDLPSSP